MILNLQSLDSWHLKILSELVSVAYRAYDILQLVWSMPICSLQSVPRSLPGTTASAWNFWGMYGKGHLAEVESLQKTKPVHSNVPRGCKEELFQLHSSPSFQSPTQATHWQNPPCSYEAYCLVLVESAHSFEPQKNSLSWHKNVFSQNVLIESIRIRLQ